MHARACKEELQLIVLLLWCGVLQSGLRGEGAVDLENDGHAGPYINLQDLGRKVSERGPGLTQDEKNRCVERHNELRQGEGSSNMESLVRIIYRIYRHIRSCLSHSRRASQRS